jgi:hypothetical protein
MLSSTGPGKPLTEAGLRQLITKALDKGFISESPHSSEDRAYRNISDDDMRYGLERGDWTIEKPPNYDQGHHSWEYLIRTVDIEGDELHLKVAAYPADNRIAVITKY